SINDCFQRALNRLLGVHGFSRRIFSNAQEFLADRNPIPAVGCMLLDVNMPGLSGLELQAELQRVSTAHCSHRDGASVVDQRAAGGMGSGALDFLQKPFGSQDEFTIPRNHRPKPSTIRGSARMPGSTRFAALSPRERDVFRLVVKGLLNKQVAFELGIVEKTVKVHRARVMEKMQADSLAELVNMSATLRLPPCNSSILSSPG
ncbi:MAG: LuxR C-terminal-related transcriptional regulator, partial [Desulfobacterales bacterium]|nr:LuxR C-terminal-related transcriptional regulator [Desulfobacterales bacterium]